MSERQFKITREAILAFNGAVGYEAPQSGDDRLMARSMFAASLLMKLLDETFEEAHVFLAQSIKFNQPVYEGDDVTAIIEVVRAVGDEIGVVYTVTREENVIVLNGEVTVQFVALPAAE